MESQPLSTEMHKKRFTVLLVDDSEHDRLFMCRALSQSPSLTVIWEAGDGEEAIAYLSGQAAFIDRKKYPIPDMVILDLKMPRVTGHDVLRWLQTQSFDKLIVVVLSGSSLPEDMALSFTLGADAYHKKSVLKEELEAMILEIEKLAAKLRPT